MLTKNYFLILLLFFVTGYVFSQNKITGVVQNIAHQPLPYVSIIVSNGQQFILGTGSDEKGQFSFIINDSVKVCHLKFSLIGHQTTEKDLSKNDMGTVQQVILIKDKNTMRAVMVVSKKPLIVRKSDRYVINVENSFLANGNSGLDVLQKAPGIWVDNNGSIRIKGNQPVMVMINDVVQRMSEEDLADYLRSLKSEDIAKIEVIQNPPAEYEAAGSGGIIHIILKKARQNGLNVAFNAAYRQQGTKHFTNTGAVINYKINNYYFTAGYTFINDRVNYYEDASIFYPGKELYENHTDRSDHAVRNQYRLGISRDIGKNQSLGLLTSITRNDMHQLYHTVSDDQQISRLITGDANTKKTRTLDFSGTTFNYNWKIDTLGSMLKVIADYSSNNKEENDGYNAAFSDTLQNSVYRNSLPNNIKIFTMQSDFIKALKSKFEIRSGIKYASINRDNTVLKEDLLNSAWAVNTAGSNQFIYKENLLMAYASVEKIIKKTTIKAGLRAEETFSKGNVITSNQVFNKNYVGLFPSVFIMHNLNEEKGSAIYLNYSKRQQRPGLSDLNPYRIEYNNYTATTGNPSLLPQYSHNIELGYQFLKDKQVSVYITQTKNIISLIANAGNNNFIEYSSLNLNKSFQYGGSISAPVKINNCWTINSSVEYFRLTYRIADENVDTKVLSAKSIHTFSIKNIADIDVDAEYSSARTYANYRSPYSFSLNAGVSIKIFRGSRLQLYCADIFNGIREKELTDINNTHIDFLRKRPTQSFTLSFAYNFSSGKKFNSKKIEQGSEEKNRSN
ncbi:MAG: outer membrane beta-barrel family protein [Ferruginibacter sp.]